MINLNKCRECLENPEFTDAYFLKIHFYLEGILKRLMLLGLRERKLQYKTAVKFIEQYDSKKIEYLIDDTFKILEIDQTILGKISKFDELKEYVIEFSSKYRNLRVHGIYDEITDIDLLQALIGCDYYFIEKIKIALERAKRPSFYKKPSEWGIKRGEIKTVGQIKGVNLSGVLHNEYQKMKYTKNVVLNNLISIASKGGMPLDIKKTRSKQ